MTSTKKEAKKITTPEFRVSYPTVYKAEKANDEAKAKFSVQMLFRIKADPNKPEEMVANLTELKAAIEAEIVNRWGADKTKWPVKNMGTAESPVWTSALRMPFRAGAEKGHGDEIIISSATSMQKPGVVYPHAGPDGKVVMIPAESGDFYAGCFAKATVVPYSYDVKGNKGVALGLRNIQKIRDGEALGGAGNPADDFEGIPVPEGETASANGAQGTAPTVPSSTDPLAALK